MESKNSPELDFRREICLSILSRNNKLTFLTKAIIALKCISFFIIIICDRKSHKGILISCV
jgi:hypothetical protein